MRRMAVSALYQRIVLEHSRAPRNFAPLPGHTHAADGVNPLCGDTLRAELRCVDGRVAELCFRGESCAITVATASMLSEHVRGLTRAEIGAAASCFERIVSGDVAGDESLGPLNALAELRRYPGRRKCALLPWAALCAALDGESATSTETRAG